MSPNPYTSTTPQTVTLVDASPGVTIYYTTNGTAPTTASTQYIGTVHGLDDNYLQAIAVGNGYGASGQAMESIESRPQ